MNTDKIIVIMEADAQLTDEQLQQLQQDAALREGCEDLFMAAHQMSIMENKEAPDTEEELRKFHKRIGIEDSTDRNEGQRHYLKTTTIVKYLLAAAAIFIGAILILKKEKPAEGIILAEDTSRQEIRIETKDGKSIPVTTVLADNQSDKKLVMHETDKSETYTVSVPYGQSLEITLSDSSKVFLHPGSKLEYPSRFDKDSREVHLKGEAYFIVAKNREKPFIVRTERSQTIVYGTEFNVRSYNQSNETVTLIKGSVGVRSKEDRHPIQIVPGQQAAFCNDGVIRLSQVNVEPYISWRDGYFYYDNEQLQDILINLGKYYNMSIECHYPELLKYHMRFIIPRNKDIHYVIEMINRMDKVHASIQGNTILVNP